MAKFIISLKKSTIGSTKSQKDTVKALGLKKINDVVKHDETPQIKGMIDKVSHLITVEKI